MFSLLGDPHQHRTHSAGCQTGTSGGQVPIHFFSCFRCCCFFIFSFSLFTDKTSFLLILMENPSLGWLSCMWRSLCQLFLWVCLNLNIKKKFCVWSFTCYTLSSTCWDRLLRVITSSQKMYVYCVYIYFSIMSLWLFLGCIYVCITRKIPTKPGKSVAWDLLPVIQKSTVELNKEENSVSLHLFGTSGSILMWILCILSEFRRQWGQGFLNL